MNFFSSSLVHLLSVALLLFTGGMAHAKSSEVNQNTKSELYPKSFALVVGVNQAAGDWSPLSSAQDDANTFADHLERRGFEVVRLFGKRATKNGILKELQTTLPKKVGQNDRFIFYFAGHGQTQKTANGKKVGYIVPADGSLLKDQDQWHTYLSMRELKSLLTEHIPSKHTLLLFDSCFSGLMFTRGGLRRSNLGAKAYLSKRGVMALTAGASGELALDGLFTPTLIQALSGEADENMDGITSFQEIALYTRREVQARRDQQTPQFGILTGSGQMIFESKVPAQTFTQNVIGAQAPKQVIEKTVVSNKASKSWGTIALGGIVLSLAGTGVIWHAMSRLKEIEKEEDDRAYNNLIEQDFGSISSEYTTGWIMTGVGLTALGWSLYKILSQPTHHVGQVSNTSLSAAGFHPLISPHSTGFVWRW